MVRERETEKELNSSCATLKTCIIVQKVKEMEIQKLIMEFDIKCPVGFTLNLEVQFCECLSAGLSVQKTVS